MKTANALLSELRALQSGDLILEPTLLLEKLTSLTEIVAQLERNTPGYDASDEIFSDSN